jgi:hypothetical protein
MQWSRLPENSKNFDYPSPDYPYVSINRYGGQPPYAGDVGGKAHGLLIVLLRSVCVQIAFFFEPLSFLHVHM